MQNILTFRGFSWFEMRKATRPSVAPQLEDHPAFRALWVLFRTRGLGLLLGWPLMLVNQPWWKALRRWQALEAIHCLTIGPSRVLLIGSSAHRRTQCMHTHRLGSAECTSFWGCPSLSNVGSVWWSEQTISLRSLQVPKSSQSTKPGRDANPFIETLDHPSRLILAE